MQVLRKILSLMLACALTLSMGAVTVFAENRAGKPMLKLSEDDLKIEIGETVTIKVTTPGVSSVEWSYPKYAPAIIDIQESSDGLQLTVTGLSWGKSVLLTAKCEGYEYAVCIVRVLSEAETSSHRIDMEQHSIQCEVGSTPTIDIKAVGVSSVYWESDDSSTASVEEVGDGYTQAKVTAKKAGRAIITARNDDGSIYDTCYIEVVEEGGMYSLPGSTLMSGNDCFIKKSDKTDMPSITWRFNNEYLEITSKKILKGANLVKEISIDEDDNELKITLNQDYSLVCPTAPNLVFDAIELTVKKDYNGILSKGDVYELVPELLSRRVGYQTATVALDSKPLDYVHEYMTTFVAANGVTSGTASISIDDVYIEGEVRAGDKVLVSLNHSIDKNLLGQFPDADIRFYNIHTNGFPRANDLQLCVEEDEFVYKVKNGKLVSSGLVWSDEAYAWVGKITSSTSYLVSDRTLGNVPDPDNDKPSSGGSGNSSSNSANKPETTEKVSDTVAALKDPKASLPAGVTKTTTAGGASISTISVPMVSGSATVGMDLFNTLGNAPANVGIKFSVSAGLTGGRMEVIIPGGFGKITEPGRIGYSMDYSPKAENNDTMLKAVKGDNATSTTAKIGGNYTLPVTATVTVASKAADGTTINIYKYDPATGKFITIGKAVVKDGKLTFGTKLMGEMLFTTGTI